MVSNVYTYYLSQYGNRSVSKYDSHKKSDLKNTYNKILRINRDSPAYKIDLSEEAQKYAIDLKESAREFGNIASSLTGSENGDIVFKKSANSDNPDIVDAKYIGDNNNENAVRELNVTVNQLATSQINTGNFLVPGNRHLTTGEYSFDLDIGSLTYEFQFGVDTKETTGDIQNKIAKLINRASIGLTAGVITDRNGASAITIESDSTGTPAMKSEIFHINNTADGAARNPVEILGLNNVSQYPGNAIFDIDGTSRTSKSNVISINGEYELMLKQASDKPVRISMKNDSDNIIETIEELVDGYNKLITITNDEKNSQFGGTSRLRREFSSIAHAYGELLAGSGLNVNDNGTLDIEESSIKQAVDNDTVMDIFKNLGKFKNAVQNKAETIALNPMDYVNNKIVAYKNPGRSFTTPYYTSAYAGMMFNGYI